MDPTPTQPTQSAALTSAPSAATQPSSQPAPAPTATPTPAPAATVTTTAPAPGCKCPVVNESDWDKKKKVLNKTFYKTFSPRLLYIPFSYAIDIDRARKLALRKGYQIPANPMILSEDGIFWGSILVEVTGAKMGDSGIVNLNQEVYTKVSKRDWKDMKIDMAELNRELGQAPKEVYSWYTSCPKCKDSKVVKTVLIAVPQTTAAPQPPAAPPQPTPTAPVQPTAPQSPQPTQPQPTPTAPVQPPTQAQ